MLRKYLEDYDLLLWYEYARTGDRYLLSQLHELQEFVATMNKTQVARADHSLISQLEAEISRLTAQQTALAMDTLYIQQQRQQTPKLFRWLWDILHGGDLQKASNLYDKLESKLTNYERRLSALQAAMRSY